MQITVKFDSGSEHTYNVVAFLDETGQVEKFDDMDAAVASVECEETGERFSDSSDSLEFARVERRGGNHELIVLDRDTGEAGWAREV